MRIRILGFKPVRYAEWRGVLAAELRYLAWADRLQLFLGIARVVWKGRKASRREWRSRMRKCLRCPVYDRTYRRCGPADYPEMGCRCYVPISNLLKPAGWLTEKLGDPDKLCW